MKRADINVGDELAYKSRRLTPSERVRVIDMKSVHYTAPYGYSGRRNVEDITLIDGSIIRGTGLYSVTELRKSNVIVVQRISPRGALTDKPFAVRAQTLVGPWAEVHAAEVEADRLAREERARKDASTAATTARGEKLIARLDEEGLKPKFFNSRYDLARGRVTLSLDDLAAIVDRISQEA